MLSRLKSTIRKLVKQPGPCPVAQKTLSLLYRSQRPRIQDAGFRVYSQTDEDGILLYLLSVAGFTNRKCVEICAGDGQENNTANLVINHGFHGLMVDGDLALVERGRRFFAEHPATYVYPPVFEHAWITRGAVNDLFRSNGFTGLVDVLSLDLDGVDYWVWESLTVIEPRIVVLEYQDILGPELCVTVPYADDFNGYAVKTGSGMADFCGASLRAFVKLGERKGYRLVATNRLGFNAFFVHRSIPESLIPTMQIEDCFTHAKVVDGRVHRYPAVADLGWVRV
jgi:hypothetical protein